MRRKSRQGGIKYRNRREGGPAARRKMGIVFAVTLGWCGVHRFAMGQWQWGLAHIFLFVASMAIFDGNLTPWTTASALLAYYTPFRWWRMSNEEFADEYFEPVVEEV